MSTLLLVVIELLLLLLVYLGAGAHAELVAHAGLQLVQGPQVAAMRARLCPHTFEDLNNFQGIGRQPCGRFVEVKADL